MTKGEVIELLRSIRFRDPESKKAVKIAIRAVKKPEIIRCKNCEKRNKWACWLYFYGHETADNYYCGYAKKAKKKKGGDGEC